MADPPRRDHITSILGGASRILRIPSWFDVDGIGALSDLGDDLARPRGDLWETCIWEESIRRTDAGITLFQAIDQRGVTVPETVDAVRAITSAATSQESVRRTNRTMGIDIDTIERVPNPA